MNQPGNDGKPVREDSLSMEELIQKALREERPEERLLFRPFSHN